MLNNSTSISPRSLPFTFELLSSLFHLGDHTRWLYMWLWISYGLIFIGQIRAWWIPYLFQFLPIRRGLVPNAAHSDYGIGKAVENLPPLRQTLSGILDRYLEVQQDILETFVDREQLHQLTQPTTLPNGRRIPGLKLDQPRPLALRHALVRFCYLAAAGTFPTRDLYPQTLQALQRTPEQYKLASLR